MIDSPRSRRQNNEKKQYVIIIIVAYKSSVLFLNKQQKREKGGDYRGHTLKNQNKRVGFYAPRTLYELRCHGKGEAYGISHFYHRFTIVSSASGRAVSSSFPRCAALTRAGLEPFKNILSNVSSGHGSDWNEVEGEEEAKENSDEGERGAEGELRMRRVRAYTSMSVTYGRRYFRTIGRDNARSGNLVVVAI